MEQNPVLLGQEVEEWFINSSQLEALRVEANLSLTKLVNQLNDKLCDRFQDCRLYLDQAFPDGNQWLDSILIGKQEPKISKDEKQRFSNYLLDSVVAIDTLIKVQISKAEHILIAVDVTTAEYKLETKLRKVRGLPEVEQSRDNKNQNIPKVRQWLGIDKHLVLVLNNQESLLPSREKLLSELQAFAKSNAITGSINLRELKPEDRIDLHPPPPFDPKRIHNQLVQANQSSKGLDQVKAIATQSLEAGYTPEQTQQILLQNPFFGAFAKSGRAELTANTLIEQASFQQRPPDKAQRAFTTFLEQYLDAAVKILVSTMEGITAPEPAVTISGDGTKSFVTDRLLWNLHPDNMVSVTRTKDGSKVMPQNASLEEMKTIRDFVVEVHRRYIQQEKPKQRENLPKQSQTPRRPKLL